MMKFFRKHRNTLMIVIAVLAIPFIFYFNKTDFSARGPGDFAKFYDRKISMVEATKYAKLLGLATQLGMTDFIQDLTAGARSDNEATVQFIFNLLILRREAEHLGIQATPAERADFVRNLRVFHGANGFDVGKYTEFTQEFLGPSGFTDAQVEDLAGDDLALRRIKQLVAVGVAVPDKEAKENYDRAYGRVSASVIRFHNVDFNKDIKVSDDDIKQYFESHKAEYKADEKRKVDFVAFTLNDQQKKLTGKERVDALQKVQAHATDFTQALLEKGVTFQQVAGKFQAPVQTTEEFTAAKPDPKLGQISNQLAATAFQLSNEDPISELAEVPDGYYVLHLAGVTPSRPLTMEEAKPKIVETVTATRARQAMSTRAAQMVHDLRESLKAGEPLAAAAQKANVKVEPVPPFVLMDDQTDSADPAKAKDKEKTPPDLVAVKNAAASLQPGELSDFFPWEDGGIVAILEKREPPDDAKYGLKKTELAQRINTNKREIVFYEWLREKQREAGILKETPPDGKKPS